MRDCTDPTDYDVRLATLEIGLAGCHGVYHGENSSVTIYDSRLRAYFGEVVEGGFVIDKSAVLDRNPALCVRSPMCSGKLKSGERDPFQGADRGSIVANAIAQDEQNPAARLAALMLAAPHCGAFDYIAPDAYAAWWRERGARVGIRRGNAIAWNDGTEETIPPFAGRFRE